MGEGAWSEPSFMPAPFHYAACWEGNEQKNVFKCFVTMAEEGLI